MKKMISAIMAICIMMCSLSMSVSANSVIDYVEPGIELMYLYTDNVSTSVYRSGSNIAYKCDAKGKSTATKISIYLYLQEYSNGAWSNVDVVTKAVNGRSAYVITGVIKIERFGESNADVNIYFAQLFIAIIV